MELTADSDNPDRLSKNSLYRSCPDIAARELFENLQVPVYRSRIGAELLGHIRNTHPLLFLSISDRSLRARNTGLSRDMAPLYRRVRF